MSQHPSLRSSDKDKKHRSVLKRFERIKILKDKEKWQEDDSVYGLPKVKIVRFKIKKEKAAAVEGAETTEAVPGAAPAAPAAGKATAPAKGAPAAKDTAKPGAAPEAKGQPKK